MSYIGIGETPTGSRKIGRRGPSNADVRRLAVAYSGARERISTSTVPYVEAANRKVAVEAQSSVRSKHREKNPNVMTPALGTGIPGNINLATIHLRSKNHALAAGCNHLAVAKNPRLC